MLLGTEIGAALTALEPFDVDVIGLNCVTGPVEMNDAVRFLGANSSKQVSVLGRAVYKLTPRELATYHKHFVQDYGVRIVGGCCGTTPEHLKAVVEEVSGVEPARREVKRSAAASSAYTSVPLDLDPARTCWTCAAPSWAKTRRVTSLRSWKRLRPACPRRCWWIRPKLTLWKRR